MKIKDLPEGSPLRGMRFKHPQTGKICIWQSQWEYVDGKAGVWYKTDPNSPRMFPLFLDSLSETLEFEVVSGKDGEMNRDNLVRDSNP